MANLAVPFAVGSKVPVHSWIPRGRGKTCFKHTTAAHLNPAILATKDCSALFTSTVDFGNCIAIFITRKTMYIGGVPYGSDIYGDGYNVCINPAVGATPNDIVVYAYRGNKRENRTGSYDGLKDPNNTKPILLFTRRTKKVEFRYNGTLNVISHTENPDGSADFWFYMNDVNRGLFEAHMSWFS